MVVWKNQLELAIHSVLLVIQGELTCWFAVPSCFPHNPKFWQANCCACYLLHAGFLLGLFFDPEDGGDMFLQNVG
jgi:hypothetical protein